MATEQSDSKAAAGSAAPILIKKYANRRLYNTSTSAYVTLEDLAKMVRAGQDFLVHDAKTNDDITRSVLTQIIVEEEAKGQNLLPVSFLRQIIALYGDSLQSLVPKYLEHSMMSFTQNQDRMRQYIDSALGGMFPFGSLEDMSRKNMDFIENAMRMFNPFQAGQGPGAAKKDAPAADKPAPADSDALSELQKKISALEKQLEGLGKKS